MWIGPRCLSLNSIILKLRKMPDVRVFKLIKGAEYIKIYKKVYKIYKIYLLKYIRIAYIINTCQYFPFHANISDQQIFTPCVLLKYMSTLLCMYFLVFLLSVYSFRYPGLSFCYPLWFHHSSYKIVMSSYECSH